MSIDKLTTQRATTAYTDTLSRNLATSASGATPTSAPQNAETNAAASPPAGAIIALSPGAQIFARARVAASAAPEVRADRIAQVQAKLAQHGNEIDADALAAKLLGGSAQ